VTHDRIRIVGIGDDGPAGISDHARQVIEAARTLYGGTRHLAMFPDHPARRVDLSADFAAALHDLVTGACGPGAVVLASGDPMLFGIGATLARHLGDAADRIEVIPHPGSAHLAFAALAEPSHDAIVLSAHGRPLAPVLAAAMPAQRFAVLLDPEHTAPVVARALLDAGLEDADAAVCEHLGSEAQRITRGPLTAIADGAFTDLAVLVVLRRIQEVERYRRTAIPIEEFAHRAGMITKPEVRALAIAALRLAPTDTLWDIGAGSGSVAVEAALTLPHGQVHAVERDAAQLPHIHANRVRFRTPHVQVVHGAAPEALRTLPDPDAVFVGGGGDDLPAIVAAVIDRLRPGGRLAATLVTLEHLAPLLAAVPAAWHPAVSQIAIAHGVPLGGGTRLDPANPVFLITATAPTEAQR
jgi:precorrin-6Y C5,15-methyltransferase (decarboxylating)